MIVCLDLLNVLSIDSKKQKTNGAKLFLQMFYAMAQLTLQPFTWKWYTES